MQLAPDTARPSNRVTSSSRAYYWLSRVLSRPASRAGSPAGDFGQHLSPLSASALARGYRLDPRGPDQGQRQGYARLINRADR